MEVHTVSDKKHNVGNHVYHSCAISYVPQTYLTPTPNSLSQPNTMGITPSLTHYYEDPERWLNHLSRCFGDKGDVEDITEGSLSHGASSSGKKGEY